MICVIDAISYSIYDKKSEVSRRKFSSWFGEENSLSGLISSLILFLFLHNDVLFWSLLSRVLQYIYTKMEREGIKMKSGPPPRVFSVPTGEGPPASLLLASQGTQFPDSYYGNVLQY